MVDNTTLPSMSGGDTIATDDIASGVAAGAKVERVKVGWGADGVYQDSNTATPVPVQPTPSTVGGWSVSSGTLTNTKSQVKSSAGTFGGYVIYNPNTVVIYVQVFDVANGSITVGTTTPTYVVPIPAGSTANLEITCGVAHATAINVAATTTSTGSTAPTTALTTTFFYK